MERLMKNERGSILIVVLWAVIFFSLVAVTLGVKAREQIHSLERFVRSARLKPLAYSGLSYVVGCFGQKDCQPSSELALPHGKFSLAITDEQSKINLNTASEKVLTALCSSSEEVGKDRAQELAKSTVVWRQRKEEFAEFGHKLSANGAGFGSVEEWMVVPGMTEKLWTKIKNSLTVYGPGRTNMNTVSEETMILLGISPSLAKRITDTRAELMGDGPFKKDKKAFTDLGDLTQKVGVSSEENAQLQNLLELWGFDTETLRIQSTASSPSTGPAASTLECVLDKKGRILYLKDM